MNDLQKKQIIQYRVEGLSYNKISEQMQLSPNTVKSYCQRNDLGGNNQCINNICKNCGTKLIHVKGKKKKLFCSDKCRNSWWNRNQEKVTRKTFKEFRCICCNKVFISYGSGYRKYCSHECYIKARFGGADYEQD